jgi:hypothetical protein
LLKGLDVTRCQPVELLQLLVLHAFKVD